MVEGAVCAGTAPGLEQVMPILDLQLIGPLPDEVRRDLAQRIADAAGRVFASRPQGTWVTLHFIPAECYSENEGGPPAGARPVIVRVLQAEPPRGDALAQEVGHLTEAVARACARPVESVHIIYEPPAGGRIAFGGRLRM